MLKLNSKFVLHSRNHLNLIPFNSKKLAILKIKVKLWNLRCHYLLFHIKYSLYTTAFSTHAKLNI